MKLTKKTRDITKRLIHVKSGHRYWIGLPVENHVKALYDLGFTKPLLHGERLLPSANGGSATRRNCDGEVVVHRDRPKETAFRQAEWHWKEFRGRYQTEERSKIVEVPYKRYPRTHLPPFAVELEIRKSHEGKLYVTAGPFLKSEDQDPTATNTANMFVELFGEATILRFDLTAWEIAPIRQLNWHLLPPGKNPWASAKPKLEDIVRKAEPGNQSVIRARFESIGVFEPEFVAVGCFGFEGYVVFGFPRLGICVLESRSVNNATYVLGSESWEEVSRLTKAQILDVNLHRARLVHREKWFDAIRALLAPPKSRRVALK